MMTRCWRESGTGAPGEKRSHSQAGFTLIELMVVIVIIGLLIALVGPQIMGSSEDAKVVAAGAQIMNFKNALDLYRLKFGEYPTTQQGLEQLINNDKRNFLQASKVPKDPWNNEYVYICPGTEGRDFEIISYGKDRVEGGSDEHTRDIVSWDLKGED